MAALRAVRPTARPLGLAGRLEEAVEHVITDVDVDVLRHPRRRVAEQTGQVLDRDAGLVECPGGEDVTKAVERPPPAPPAPRPVHGLRSWIPGLAAVVGTAHPAPSRGGEQQLSGLELVEPSLHQFG